MKLRSKYAGLSPEGRHTYDLTIRIPDMPEGLAIIRGVTSEDLATGKEFEANFVAFGRPDYKFGKVGMSKAQVRASVTRQERRTAESLGGHRQTGSGAVRGYKGDGRVEGRFRIENKMTQAESMRVKLQDLRKIRSECEGLEAPVFEVEFRDRHTLRPKEKWALVPWEVWEKMANEADDD